MAMNETIPTEEEITIELRRVLGGRRFSANQNSARFLALVVGKAIRGEPIRQSIIGSELFPDKYAKNDISDVRVTANKLRRILAEYFEQEGKDDPVVIALPTPPGPNEPKLPEGKAYKPLFSYNSRNAAVADYLTGCFHLAQADPESDPAAMRHFNRAIEREPRYSAPYVGKAELLLRWAIYGGWRYAIQGSGPRSVRQCLADAERLLRVALRHDSHAWRAHATLGAVHTCYCRWAEAGQCFEDALNINAHDTRYQSWYYAAYLLAVGRTDDAMQIVQSRSRRNPDDPTARTIHGCFLYMARDFSHASLALSHAGNMDERNWISAFVLAQVFLEEGSPETSLTALELTSGAPPIRFRRRRTLTLTMSGLHIVCLARTGKKKEALARLREAEKGGTPPLQLALAYMGLGRMDEAVAALSKTFAERYPLMAWLHPWPIFDPLREHPRFQKLLKRMKLPADS